MRVKPHAVRGRERLAAGPSGGLPVEGTAQQIGRWRGCCVVFPDMGPIVVLYATRQGQARRVAEYLALRLRALGAIVDVYDLASLPDAFSLSRYSQAVLAASVHVGKHEPEMVAFATEHRASLHAMPTWFLSVSGGEATAEDASAPADVRARASQQAQACIDRFIAATGWHPGHVKPVAGAMLYTQYNFLVRFIIRHIAKRSGTKVDTTRDREYTDWTSIDRVAGELVTASA